MTSYVCSDDAITHVLTVIGAPDVKVSILLRELRRERTGLHGLVAVAEGGKVLSHDTFNVGRSEDRRRLAKGAHGLMTRTTQELLAMDGLLHQLDMVCLWAMTEWENNRVDIVDIDAADPVAPRLMLLFPHVEFGTGTIVFGVPGVGKSWLLALMAVSLTAGIETLWAGPRRSPCLYVDLERNELAFRRRLFQVASAMHVTLPPISYLKGRGLGLASLRRKLRAWTADHPKGVILYDSISRMGGGSLVDDDVANGMIDLANAASDTWVALAHSPRADAGHIFGSQMYDAGADMMIKMASQHRGDTLGSTLTVTKANHAGRVPVFVYELEFGPSGLSGFKRCDQSDWPELAPSIPDLLEALLATGEKNIKELTDAAKLPRQTVVDNLGRHLDRFENLGQRGREVYWGVKTRPVVF